MNSEKKSNREPDDFTLLGIELREGLDRMVEFERELKSYSRETLILFIVLYLEEQAFGKALEILDKLDPVSGEDPVRVTY